MYFEIYMFNITNPNEWAANPKNVKPDFQELGPYVFQEVRERVGIEFNGTTVAFNQTRTWHFVPEKSGNLSLDDLITNINPVSATLDFNLRFLPRWQRSLAHTILDAMGSLMIRRSVRQLIFDGYKDNQLDYLSKAKKLIPSLPSIPLTKFGWFVERNRSAIHDGRMEMNTGKKNIYHLGLVKQWNGVNHTKYFPRECGNVYGTTGELWPPVKDPQQPVTMYVVDICRPLTLQPEGNLTKFGMKGITWAGDRKMLDGMDSSTDSTCWCLGSTCPDLKPGVFNASTCQFGAPAFMSYPHFYLADPSYRDAITGMAPNASLHKFYVSLNPKFGIPLEVRARLQINLMIQNDPASPLYKNVPTMFIPMFWFSQVADITEELALKAAVMNEVQTGGMWSAYVLASIGLILLVVGVLIALRSEPLGGLEDDDVPILDDASGVASQPETTNAVE